MPMHNIPTERPYGENSEFRDGKYFNIATPNVQPTSNDTTFDDIFKNDIELKNSNIPVEKVDEEIKPTMPMFDFSNSTPLDNIETVSFGSDVPIAGQTTITPLTELPDVEDLAAITENIPTLEEMQLNLSDHMPVMENNNLEVNPTVEPSETPVVAEASPVVEELTPVNPVVGNIAPEIPTTPINETPVMEVTEPTNVAVSNDLSNISQEIPTYNIPTFDPDNGTTMTTVSEDVTPLVNNVAPVVEETSVVEEAPTIKLPFDGDTLNNLKNEFVNMLKAKGFNVNVDDMDFADSYKLIFTIEK